MRELNFSEVEVVSGGQGPNNSSYGRPDFGRGDDTPGPSLSNGGNWDNSFSQAGVGFATGFAAAWSTPPPVRLIIASITGAGAFANTFDWSW